MHRFFIAAASAAFMAVAVCAPTTFVSTAIAQTAGRTDIPKLGSLTITAPWTRATPRGAQVAGGYVRITNTGTQADRLTGGAFDLSARVEVHEMAMDGSIMRMRQLSGGLEIKPGETVELKPGGLHLMFMDLKSPVATGKPVKGRLTFEKAGSIDVDFVVAPIGAASPAASGGHGAGHGH